MEFLYLLEKIRNPVCDFLFSAITLLGEETAFLLMAILIFWCVNKRHGYFVLISGLFGTVVNQVMKLACKVPRPWHRDTSFTIVESAREGATGYSFPSGHSQNSVSTAGAIFLTTSKRWIKIVAITVAVLVPLSRMYLGVHTPWDVLAGAACAVVIILLLEPVFASEERFHKLMPFIVGALALAAVGFFIYAECTPLPHEMHISYDSVVSAKKNAGTMLGCALGAILVYTLDRLVIKFETGGVWYAQVIKLVLGLAIVFVIKSFADIPLAFMGSYERIVRYFLIVAFAGSVWPLTFKWFAGLRIGFMDRFTAWVVGLFKKPEPERVTATYGGTKKRKKRRK